MESRPQNELVLHPHLHIVSGLGPRPPGAPVFPQVRTFRFHPHAGGLRIGLGATVPFPERMGLGFVFVLPRQTVLFQLLQHWRLPAADGRQQMIQCGNRLFELFRIELAASPAVLLLVLVPIFRLLRWVGLLDLMQQRLDLFLQARLLLTVALGPHQQVLVGVGCDLGPVDKLVLQPHIPRFD
jgi:hypothetical protein